MNEAVDNFENGDAAGAADAAASGGNDSGGKDEYTPSVTESMQNPDVFKDGMFFGHYKSLEEAGKALTHANTKLRERAEEKPVAPEKYEFDFSKNDKLKDLEINIDDHPLGKVMLPLFKDRNVPQDLASDLVSAFLEHEADGVRDPKAELESLGEDAEKITTEVLAYVSKLPKEKAQIVEDMITTGPEFRMMHEIIGLIGEKQIPTEQDNVSGKSYSQLVNEAMQYKKDNASTISGNDAQQKHYNALMAQAARLKAAGKA